MASREILLDVASFLDSKPARALVAPGREELRTIATRVLSACYEDLGKRPRFIDGEDARALLTECLPGRFKRKDPLADHVPAVLDAWLAHLVETEVVTHAYELGTGIAASIDAFVATVRAGTNEPRATGGRQAPVVHQAEKLGRNDPCSCGSGKKFKKCHGKES